MIGYNFTPQKFEGCNDNKQDQTIQM